MERFIPVEIFLKKGNTFRGIPFFPFLPKRPKFSVTFVSITSARLHVERKRKIYRYFVNGTTQSRSCFRCQKNTSTIRRKFFTEISVPMVSVTSVFKGHIIHSFPSPLLRICLFLSIYTQLFHKKVQLTAHWKCGFPKKNLKGNEAFQRGSLKKIQLKRKKKNR